MNFIKKTSLLVLFAAALTACEKEETTNHLTDCEEFGVEKTELSCNSYTFTSNVTGVDPNPDWYVYTHPNTTPVYYGNDSNAFEFNPTTPGNYTVEAVYKSDLCDEAVTKGFDVDVYDECFINEDTNEEVGCESFAVEKTQHNECSSFSFTTNVDHAYMKVNGELKATGQKAFDFTGEKHEKYTIEIGYEGGGCPNGTSREFFIDMDEECIIDEDIDGDIDGDIDEDIDEDIDGDIDEDIDEDIDGEFDEDIDGEFDGDIDGEFDCESFDVEKTKHSCNSFSFTTNVDNAYMKVDGELVTYGQKAFDWDPKGPESYTIEIGYEGEGCPNGTSRTFIIHVDEECFR